jgi:hypothetical protein
VAHLEWKSEIGLVQWLRFDAVRTVEVSQKSTPTRHPVQKGADITDHVRVDLPHVSITGVITIAPLTVDSMVVGPKLPIANGIYQPVSLPGPPVSVSPSPLQGGLIQAAVDALSSSVSPSSVTSLITLFPETRVGAAAAALLELQEKRTFVRFVDQLRTYENMIVTSVVGTRTQQFYGAAFQVELDAINVVESKLVDLPVPAEPRGQTTKSTASSPKNNPSPAVEEAQKSFLLGGVQKLFSFP